MTHQDWITAIATAIAAFVGGVGGSVLVLLAARWTNAAVKAVADADRKAQSELVSLQHEAAVEASARERELDRQEQRDGIARNAAVGLLDRIGDLNRVLPHLHLHHRPGFGGDHAAKTEAAREGRASLQRGLRTDLLLVNDADVVERYRQLATLASDLAEARFDDEIVLNRARQDVENYMKYVLITLQRFVNGEALPSATAPPILRRNPKDGSNWTPQEIPPDWDRV